MKHTQKKNPQGAVLIISSKLNTEVILGKWSYLEKKNMSYIQDLTS